MIWDVPDPLRSVERTHTSKMNTTSRIRSTLRVSVGASIRSGRIKLYARYLDDTLLLVKPEDVNGILRELNSYHNNLEFSVEKFEDSVSHFLDLDIIQTDCQYFTKKPTKRNSYITIALYVFEESWRDNLEYFNAF